MKNQPASILISASRLNLYEATVAVEYHIQQLCEKGTRPILEQRGGMFLSDSNYTNAIRQGLGSARASRKQQEEFLRRPRDFELRLQTMYRRGGWFGIGRGNHPSHYEAFATSTCASCGGQIIWKSMGCDLEQEKVCKNCGALARVLDKQPPIQPHEYGDKESGERDGDKCKLRKVCRVCGHEQVLYFKHTYPGEDGMIEGWKYVQENSCEQFRKCIECGKTESRIEHAGEWSGEVSCVVDGMIFYTYERTCIRCGTIETR